LLRPDAFKADPNQLALLRRASLLTQSIASPWFRTARMTRMSGQSVSSFTFREPGNDSLLRTSPEVEMSAWAAPGGGPRALMLANCRYSGPSYLTLPTQVDGRPIPQST